MDKTDVATLISNVENELLIIADKGLNSSNFETCYKLVDMIFKLDMIKSSRSCKCSHYDDYMNAKRIYRHSHTETNQENIIRTLDEYMNELTDTITNMVNDCDCENEKQTIRNYISKL